MLTAGTVASLDVEVVCGGANNQLASPDVADHLTERGILYAPDYVVNAGGVIAVSDELHPRGPSPQRCRDSAEGIADTLAAVFTTAEADGVSTEVAARRVATARMAAVGRLRGFLCRDGTGSTADPAGHRGLLPRHVVDGRGCQVRRLDEVGASVIVTGNPNVRAGSRHAGRPGRRRCWCGRMHR